jgi:hypothetical protein
MTSLERRQTMAISDQSNNAHVPAVRGNALLEALELTTRLTSESKVKLALIGLTTRRRIPCISSFDSRLSRWAVILLTFSLCMLTSFEAKAQILWGDSAKYDNGGLNPTVVINNTGTIVEVHNGGAGVGPLWYRVGQLSGSTIQWGDSAKYDNGGLKPAVAINDTNVVEVHNGGAGVGPLWYRVGQLSGLTIQWGDSAKYDNGGLNPGVGMNDNGTIIEVHNGGAGVGPLWYRVGRVR